MSDSQNGNRGVRCGDSINPGESSIPGQAMFCYPNVVDPYVDVTLHVFIRGRMRCQWAALGGERQHAGVVRRAVTLASSQRIRARTPIGAVAIIEAQTGIVNR